VSNESLTMILDSLRKQGNASSLSGGLQSKKPPKVLDTNYQKLVLELVQERRYNENEKRKNNAS